MDSKPNSLAEYTPPLDAKKGPLALRNLDFKQMLFVGELMFNAKMFTDLHDIAQAQVKIMAGQELGLSPMQSMNAFHVIHGRVTLAANTMAMKVKESGKYDYHVDSLTEDVCIIQFYEIVAGKKVSLGLSDFTKEDAIKAGTQNMGKFSRNMLFARALSNGVKWYAPDIFSMPVYVEGEIIETEIVGDGMPTAEEHAARLEEEKQSRREHAAKAGSRRTAAKVDAQEPAETTQTPEPSNPTPEAPEAVQTAPNESQEATVPEATAPTPESAEQLADAAAKAKAQIEGQPETYMTPPPLPPKPEAAAAPASDFDDDEDGPHSDEQRKAIMAKLTELGFKEADEKRQICAGLLAQPELTSFSKITKKEAQAILDSLADVNDGDVLRGMFITIAEDQNATT